MEVEFLEKFSKDLDHIHRKSVRTGILKLILKVEAAADLSAIPNVKKLMGHKTAYRIRLGDHRIGVFVEKKTLTFARVVDRKDIYRVFP